MRDPSPPEVGLDLLCLHPPPDTCPAPSALPLPPRLCPPFGPSPSLLALPYHCLLVLWTSSPLCPEVSGSPSAAWAAAARAAGRASTAEQLSSARACSAGPPPCRDHAVCTNKQIRLETQSYAPKGNDHWMVLLNPP